MFNYYELGVLPIILKRFKVKNIVQSGALDNSICNHIREYCETNNCSSVTVGFKNNFESDVKECPLNVLPTLKNYDAIFLNDDSNWYTVYNELNIIKNTNNEFPLVFICNNVFPNKWRDSYIDPEIIPEEFRHDFSEKLVYNDFNIEDGFFHAVEENTPKNGVSTAINDFLAENNSIDILDLKFQNGIIILYPKNSISEIRLGLLSDEIREYSLDYDISDIIVENSLLSNHISKFSNSNGIDSVFDFDDQFEQQEKLIKDYENQIKLHENELSYKNSQIEAVAVELDLKELEIKDFETKLTIRENNINNLENELQLANNHIASLKIDFEEKEREFKNNEAGLINEIDLLKQEVDSLKSVISKRDSLESELNLKINELNDELTECNTQLDNNHDIISKKDDQIRIKQDELLEKDSRLNSILRQNNYQLAKLDNQEYCIECYQREIDNKRVEIQYLKRNSFIKKLLKPSAPLYLFFKSNPKELLLNYKLYKSLKESQCFDIGFYLNNNEDIIESKWSKYFSPELHYVCNGFDEKRNFNKKYFNRNSKKELLDYILKCS